LNQDARGNYQNQVLVRTVLLIMAVIGSLAFLGGVGPSYDRVDLSFIGYSLALAVLMVYLGSMARLSLGGDLAVPLSDGFYVASPAVCLAAIAMLSPSYYPEIVHAAGGPLLLIAGLATAGSIAHSVGSPYWVPLRSLVAVGGGVLAYLVLSTMGLGSLGFALLIAMVAVGALFAMGMFSEHSNATLRDLSKPLVKDRNFLLAVVAAGLVALYAGFFRERAGLSAGATAAVDWLLVAGLALLVALLGLRAVRREVPEVPEWSEVTAAIARMPTDLAVATSAVRDFVEEGRKERLVVLVAGAMRSGGVGDDRAAQTIQELVRYRPRHIPLAMAWTYGDISRRAKDERMLIVTKMLKEASALVAGTPPQNQGE
jgi:hypothetical protein